MANKANKFESSTETGSGRSEGKAETGPKECIGCGWPVAWQAQPISAKCGRCAKANQLFERALAWAKANADKLTPPNPDLDLFLAGAHHNGFDFDYLAFIEKLEQANEGELDLWFALMDYTNKHPDEEDLLFSHLAHIQNGCLREKTLCLKCPIRSGFDSEDPACMRCGGVDFS